MVGEPLRSARSRTLMHIRQNSMINYANCHVHRRASAAMAPVAWMCSWRPLHRTPSNGDMASSHELTKRVRFLMNLPVCGPDRTFCPVAHWSITREVTRG